MIISVCVLHLPGGGGCQQLILRSQNLGGRSETVLFFLLGEGGGESEAPEREGGCRVFFLKIPWGEALPGESGGGGPRGRERGFFFVGCFFFFVFFFGAEILAKLKSGHKNHKHKQILGDCPGIGWVANICLCFVLGSFLLQEGKTRERKKTRKIPG